MYKVTNTITNTIKGLLLDPCALHGRLLYVALTQQQLQHSKAACASIGTVTAKGVSG